MKIVATTLMTMAITANAFAPLPSARTTTELSMGLFDFLQPKPQETKGGDNKMDAGVFGGKGARITVREDEDNAMQVTFELHSLASACIVLI